MSKPIQNPARPAKPGRDPLRSLSFLSAEDRAEILGHAVAVPFQAREPILIEGTRLDAVFVISTGYAAERYGDPAGHVVQAVLGPGDLIGEVGLLSGAPAVASVIGLEAGQVLRVPHAVLLELLRRDGLGQRFFRSLAALLSSRLRDTARALPPFLAEQAVGLSGPPPLLGNPSHLPHHAPLCGRMRLGTVPLSLTTAVRGFVLGMRDLEARLQRQGDPAETDSAALQAEVRSDSAGEVVRLCDGLMRALTAAVQGTADARRAAAYGVQALRETFPLFMTSRLIDRAYAKPRGYAGDYATLDLIYENQADGDGRLGPLVDGWLLRRPSSRGVRGRRLFLRDMLVERFRSHGVPGRSDSFHVLSLGAGGAREVFDFFAALGDPRAARAVQVSCLDLDPEALRHTAQQAQGLGLLDRFHFLQANVLDLSAGRAPRPLHLPPQDIIYAAGLLDSLEDEGAAALVGWAHTALTPGGLAVFSNVEPSCADRALYDHILDWRLCYRGSEELLALLQRGPFRHCRTDVRWDEDRAHVFVLVERDGAPA